MTVTPVTARRAPEARSGFALLITITLLAFLVLLLVSLASLTRVETQVATNNQQVAQARQNALMALNIALGELQKYAGPDQRTTVLADLDASLANTASRSGRWVGVYGSGVAADYTDAPAVVADKIAAGSSASTGSQARLLNWLVSGNETTSFNPEADVGTSGEITAAPSSFRFKPDGAVSGITDASTALSTDIRIADRDNTPQPACLLVGPNTVGADSADLSLSSYVVAPIREVTGIATGQGAAPVTLGRYAWWVGDEGAKARVNLPAATAVRARNAFVSAPRAGVEFVDYRNPAGAATMDASDMLDPTGATARYNPAHANLPSVLLPEQLPMLSSAQAPALRQVAQYRFHDLTTWSSTVLADAYAGGLRQDLSALLASGATSPAATDHVFQPEPGAHYGVPTWGLLRSYTNTRTTTGRELTARIPTTTQMGVAPVLTYGGVGFQYVSSGGVGDPIQLALFPIAVLWNPYNATLKGARYEFGVVRRWSAMVQLQAYTPDKTTAWTIKETRDFARAGSLVTGGAAPHADGSANITATTAGTAPMTDGNYLRFVIDASDMDLAPGESMVFTLPTNQTYSAPMSGQPANALRKGIRATTHALMPAASSVAAVHPSTPLDPESEFRVAVYGENNSNRTMYSPATVDYHFSGSEADVYFGEVAAQGPDGYGLEPGGSGNPKPWIQSISRFTPGVKPGSSVTAVKDGASVATVLQGPGPLPAVPTAPEFVIAVRSTFSNTTASTGVRWIAQANPRASLLTRSRLDASVPAKGGATDGASWQNFTLAPSGNASSGASLNAGTSIVNTTLFEHLPEDLPLLSLGQLQHANLSLLGTYPAYPLGNSLADYHFRGSSGDFLGRLHRGDGYSGTTNPSTNPTHLITTYYDVSYLINRAFWDRYFVSTVPHAGTGVLGDDEATTIPDVLPNPRHVKQAGVGDDALREADKAAAGLMLAGGFNINSTSEQAWRAVLGGINRLPYNPETGATGAELKAALPRFTHPTVAGNADNVPWQGYRQLTEVQIAQLARNIVAEIRNRGPFVSLGDFVNRRLRDNPATTAAILSADERFKGAIQNAIDTSGAVATSASAGTQHRLSGATAVNAGSTSAFTNASPFTVNGVSYGGTAYTDVSLTRGGPAYVAPYASRAAFLPQHLTQADVLSAIGPGLAARSDTFIVRTYGEAINPALAASDGGYVTGRAWCEAVVQRVVEPVRRKSHDAAAADYNEPAAAAGGQPDFGRRFKVVSFRWLTPQDI